MVYLTTKEKERQRQEVYDVVYDVVCLSIIGAFVVWVVSNL
jgi:hypothetical protein